MVMLRLLLLFAMTVSASSCGTIGVQHTVNAVSSEESSPAAQADAIDDVFDPELRAKLALAEQGDAQAQFAMARAYAKGQGVRKDSARALRWYRLSAAQGDAFMLFHLGSQLWEGLEVPKDESEARWYWTLAAEQGFPPAQAALGTVLSIGSQDIVIDKVQAYVWLSLASAQGDEAAAQRLGKLKKQLNSAQIAKARQSLTQWKPSRVVSVVSAKSR